jgi:hypothetical protein
MLDGEGRGSDDEEVAMTHRADTEQPRAAALTSEQVWHQLAKASFAVLTCVTPAGAPRSTGVVYKTMDRRLYVVVGPDSWKARHIAADGRVSLTVPVRRGGLLSLVAPIPPATINFHATATVHARGTMALPDDLASLLPPDRRTDGCVVEVVPEGEFLTYGIGVSLMKMRDRAAALAHVPVVPHAPTG